MNHRKLARELGGVELAMLLCKQGLMTPGQIARATDAEIEEAVGKERLVDVRNKIPARLVEPSP